MSPPAGRAIRAQLGSRYFMVPAGPFQCRWHRRGLDPDDLRRHFDATGKPYIHTCEDGHLLWRGPVRQDPHEGLIHQLPDLRSVAFIAADSIYGSEPESRRPPILQAARESRGRLIVHAYDVSLEMHQRWQEVGPALSRLIHAQSRRNLAPQLSHLPDLALPESDLALARWISLYAPDLYCRVDSSDDEKRAFEERLKTSKPFESAFATVAAATGYTADTIETFRAESRRLAAG